MTKTTELKYINQSSKQESKSKQSKTRQNKGNEETRIKWTWQKKLVHRSPWFIDRSLEQVKESCIALDKCTTIRDKTTKDCPKRYLHGLVPWYSIHLKGSRGWVMGAFCILLHVQKHESYRIILSEWKDSSKAISQLSRRLTRLDMPITQSQGNQLLQTSIDLVMHRRVLRRGLVEFLE